MNQQSLSSLIWSVDLLRGDYKQSEYGKVILEFTVLRRLDCVLQPTKGAVLAEQAARKKQGLNAEPFLLRRLSRVYNTSPPRSGRSCALQSRSPTLIWLERLESVEKDLETLEQRIQEKLKPYAAQLALLKEIPGVDWTLLRSSSRNSAST
jgi:type I restriction-modification system DNA methylase subunit